MLILIALPVVKPCPSTITLLSVMLTVFLVRLWLLFAGVVKNSTLFSKANPSYNSIVLSSIRFTYNTCPFSIPPIGVFVRVSYDTGSPEVNP